MKVLLQRVLSASVCVDGQVVGQIERGLLAYVGFGKFDGVDVLNGVQKVLDYRIFAQGGKLSLNVSQIDGGVLWVPQFTLYARTNKGLRPDFSDAMPPDLAREKFDTLQKIALDKHPNSAFGKFGAHMQVSAINDGPLNFLLEF